MTSISIIRGRFPRDYHDEKYYPWVKARWINKAIIWMNHCRIALSSGRRGIDVSSRGKHVGLRLRCTVVEYVEPLSNRMARCRRMVEGADVDVIVRRSVVMC